MARRIIIIGSLCCLALLSAGSLLNLSSSPHWFVRGWEFPRVQILVMGWLLFGVISLVQYFTATWSSKMSAFGLAMAVFLTAWHGYRIYPYTVLASTQAKTTDPSLLAMAERDPAVVRAVFSNVKMENHEFGHWMESMREASPDVIVALEVDQAWMKGIAPLLAEYEYQVAVPQDNWYGMLLLSVMPIETHEVRYLVQEDIPSIDATLRIDSDETVRLVAVHPRPPEPIRDTSAVNRDAELILWGRELAEETRPVIIGGDLNDVAWSRTTRLFMRTSGLLDPRRGRGLFNSFHAGRPYMRFPLDHVFFSPHFTLNWVQRLSDVGSDHFPFMVELRLAPQKSQQHNSLQREAGDRRKAEQRVDRADESNNAEGSAVDDTGEEGTGAIETEQESAPGGKNR